MKLSYLNPFLASKRIKFLEKENRILKNAISPLTDLGYPVENINALLKPLAELLKKEIKRQQDASFQSRGQASSPVSSQPIRPSRW